MKITVAAFYADVPGQRSRAAEFHRYALAGKRALEITNPGARFVLLTDRATAPLFERDMEVAAVGPAGIPLMFQVMEAQRAFVRSVDTDLLVLPDLDAIVNNDIRKAIPYDVGMAITHKGRKFEYKINNLAYVYDRELADWFFGRALDILATMPAERHQWWGDQEAWEKVVGVPVDDVENLPPQLIRTAEEEVLVAKLDGRTIHLYPNATHNCPMSNDGSIRPAQIKAFVVHFKGERKQFIDRFMAERFGI